MTDTPDPATVDRLQWLTQLDDAHGDDYDRLRTAGLYEQACDGLLDHLARTERMRGTLDPEDGRLRDARGHFTKGPRFGVGPAPDYDVAAEGVRISYAIVAASRYTRAVRDQPELLVVAP